MKVRRIDFSPDEWLAGTVPLDNAERGLYITACALIYSAGGPIPIPHLRAACRDHGNAFSRQLRRLIELGKLSRNGEEIVNKRSINELQKADKRAANGRQNIAQRWKNNGLNDELVLQATNTRARAINHQPSTNKKERESLVASPRAHARERPEPDIGTRPSQILKKDQEGKGRIGEPPAGWFADAEAARDEAGLDAVNLSLEWAKFAGRADGPVELRRWIEWALRAWVSREPKPADPAEVVPTTPWANRMRAWHETGFWMPDFGPKPGEPGCFVPPEYREAAE